MQEQVYNICDILSVLRLKTCKRRITPTTHTERRTLRSTHTPLTEHRKRSSLERKRSKRRRRAAAVYPPPYREVPSKKQPSSAPKTPPKFHEAPPPAGVPPLVSELIPARAHVQRARAATGRDPIIPRLRMLRRPPDDRASEVAASEARCCRARLDAVRTVQMDMRFRCSRQRAASAFRGDDAGAQRLRRRFPGR